MYFKQAFTDFAVIDYTKKYMTMCEGLKILYPLVDGQRQH